MLLIVHILIEEIQDIHYHTVGFTGGAVWIEVDGILIIIQSLLPVPLFTIGIPQEIESLIPVSGVGAQIIVKQSDSFDYISLIDKFFYWIQLLHIVLNFGLLKYKDSFYLETMSKYSVKNKKNEEIKCPKFDGILSECHNFGLKL